MERAEEALRRADARGLRDDRGEPPDGLQPAATRPRACAGSVGRPDRHRDPHRRRGRRVVPAGQRRRGRDPRARASPTGYLHNPEANAEAFFDGWFRTGDRGVLERRLPASRGPAQGDDPPRRREHLPGRDRGGAARPPGRHRRGLLRHRRREVRRDGRRRRRALRARSTEASSIGYCRERLAAFKVPDDDPHPRRRSRAPPTGKVQRRRVGQDRSRPSRR